MSDANGDEDAYEEVGVAAEEAPPAEKPGREIGLDDLLKNDAADRMVQQQEAGGMQDEQDDEIAEEEPSCPVKLQES